MGNHFNGPLSVRGGERRKEVGGGEERCSGWFKDAISFSCLVWNIMNQTITTISGHDFSHIDLFWRENNV